MAEIMQQESDPTLPLPPSPPLPLFTSSRRKIPRRRRLPPQQPTSARVSPNQDVGSSFQQDSSNGHQADLSPASNGRQADLSPASNVRQADKETFARLAFLNSNGTSSSPKQDVISLLHSNDPNHPIIVSDEDTESATLVESSMSHENAQPPRKRPKLDPSQQFAARTFMNPPYLTTPLQYEMTAVLQHVSGIQDQCEQLLPGHGSFLANFIYQYFLHVTSTSSNQ